jgi:hypothetical protein
MFALSRLCLLGLLALLLLAPAPAAAQHPLWQPYRPTYGLWYSHPWHAAYPWTDGPLPTYTEYWPLLQPGWGIPTMNNGSFRGAHWILDMSQPLFPPPGPVMLPPPQGAP